MPANEQQWRNPKFLHLVFGLTGLAMLGTTIWMLAADHLREWKNYQRKFRDVETWVTQARIDEQETGQFSAQTDKLKARVAQTQATVPPHALVEQFERVAETPLEQSATAGQTRATVNGYNVDAVRNAETDLRRAAELKEKPSVIADRRSDLLAAMQDILKRAKFDEDRRGGQLKFSRADLDVQRSQYSLGVDAGMEESKLASIQAKADEVKDRVDKQTIDYQSAKAHRLALQGVLEKITADEVAAKKALDDHLQNVNRLTKAKEDRENTFKKGLLELPVIDAFGRPLKIDQIWLPKLTINNNFSDVARFDRCTTCHQGIEKTAPGSPINPGYESLQDVTLKIETPKKAPTITNDSKGQASALESVYGLKLADQGLIVPDDVTIEVVWPRTAAARAGIQAGDVVRFISDVKATEKQRVYTYLLQSVKWGQPVTIKVERGVPHPFSSHPRLDLFVGSLSPHKMGDVGCTICHEGQGSATAFKWASHTPNTPAEADEWKREHGWFNNHHWIFPQLPKRFAESSCLKCHHGVTELASSERFPEPPAPKLLAGYNVIRQYGCFGCHEIQGFDGPHKRRGPDMRAEPTHYAEAAQVLADPALTGEQRRLAREIMEHPELTEERHRLAEMLTLSGQPHEAEDKADAPATKTGPKLRPETRKMAAMLAADEATPGSLRKVGPSLRHVGHKVDLNFLYTWIRRPQDFRPNTKMPQFFGLNDHLLPDQKIGEDGKPVFENGKPVMEPSPGLHASQQFEPVEVRGVAEYLLNATQDFEYADRPKGVTEDPSAERGKELFETRGCLACHRHPEFPKAVNTQGPDLSRIGAKLAGSKGMRWLYSWLRQPDRYHARTVMPNVFLEPIHDGKKISDPAADIAVFLMQDRESWKPAKVPEVDGAALDRLAVMYLSATFTRREAEKYARQGIPAAMGTDLKGDEAVLVVDKPLAPDQLVQKKLLYIGRRTITRLGCSGCHDIPGYEDAKPIGTGLADWGRKETSKLAFEQIIPYLERTLATGHHGAGEGHASGQSQAGNQPHALHPDRMDPDTGFYVEKLLGHEREGFIWQKIREPRSYDFKKTETKDYTDRLRMPKFYITDAQREAVITFVLGLVSEPPTARYVYQSTPRRKAIVEGEKLLAKFNCTGCHTVQMEQWAINYKPYDPDDETSFQPPPPVTDYPFVLPHFTPQELAASKKADRRGLGTALLTGMPNPEVGEDDEGRPLHYFGLWKNEAIDGHAWLAGGQEVPVLEPQIIDRMPPQGGDLARLIHPVVLAHEKKTNPNAKASDAWGWVPPPLVGEGRKVQSQWVHDFLLDPFPIRPAVVLRMPKFNMSSDEASALANYFAAMDDAQYPYAFDARKRRQYLAEKDDSHPHRLDDALKLITDNNYCVKCHLIGDFVPVGSVAALAPRLDRVNQRLRPEFLERWIANPKRLLPYTGMPVNFPIDKPADQKLFKGHSVDQVEAVVDLLLNWPTEMGERTSIKKMVKPAAAPPATAGAAK
jgi:cytochrome c2